jgi:hypothetical protein
MGWAALWSVLGAIGVTLSAWVRGYLSGFLPPLPRVMRAVGNTARQCRRGSAPVADEGSYHLVLCGLDGDDHNEGTLRLLRHALNPQDYPMLRVTLSARCIRLGPWHARRDATAGSAQADRVLREHGADAVLWGEVPKQGDSLRFFLRGAGRQETQILPFDKGLANNRPDGTLGTVLAAVALSQITPVTEEAGHYLASRLRPVAARLEALLADPRLVPVTEAGHLHHALGVTLGVIGDRAGCGGEEDGTKHLLHLWFSSQWSQGALLHGSTSGRSPAPAATIYVRRTYSGRPSSSMRFSEATAMATSVVCRPPVRERSASPITRL